MELIARNPYQLQTAHAQMVEWCDRKIAEFHEAARKTEAAMQIAVERQWKVGKLNARHLMHKKKVVFYTKIKAALSEGYFIVPNFDCSIFAIRTKKDAPVRHAKESHWGTNHKQSAQLLPIEEGRYVSPDPSIHHETYQDKNSKGESVTKHLYWPTEFQEVEFPFDLAKPEVMNPVAQAMATKIFDLFGVARNTVQGYATKRGDPIIIGIIKNPQTSRPDLSCFITWSFNPESL